MMIIEQDKDNIETTNVTFLQIIPLEIIKIILKYVVSGFDRVLSVSYRVTCNVFSKHIRPVNKRLFIYNMIAVSDKMMLATLYAYRYNQSLFKCVVNLYTQLKKQKQLTDLCILWGSIHKSNVDIQHC